MGRRHDPAASAAPTQTEDPPEAILAGLEELAFLPEDDRDLAALDDEALARAIDLMLDVLDHQVGLPPGARRRHARAVRLQVEPLADGEDPLAEAELARPPRAQEAPAPALPSPEHPEGTRRIKRHSCSACTCVIGPGYHSDEVYYDPDAHQRLCRMCADWRNQQGAHARCQRIMDADELLRLGVLQREKLMQERSAALRTPAEPRRAARGGRARPQPKPSAGRPAGRTA
jgi:hypothetical protein